MNFQTYSVFLKTIFILYPLMDKEITVRHWYDLGVGRPEWKKTLKKKIHTERLAIDPVSMLDTRKRMRRRLKKCKVRAAELSVKWDLDDRYALALLAECICHYCCRKLEQTDTLSLKDPAAGFVFENVVPSCSQCHEARGKCSYGDFLVIVKKHTELQELMKRPPI